VGPVQPLSHPHPVTQDSTNVSFTFDQHMDYEGLRFFFQRPPP
jgi:hypothetical protein